MTQDTQFRDRLLERISLAELIGKRVKLKRQGSSYIGLCPFHNEKTPSFSVVEDKNYYNCFGCGASGDAITFVMETENLSFPEALRSLAESVGMQVPSYKKPDPEKTERRANDYELLQKASDYFRTQLFGEQGRSAYAYLRGRGLDDATMETFGLGFAPPPSRALLESDLFKHADSETLASLERLSLIRKSQRDNSFYGFFRNRIMFPIHDRRGRIIAFGGRYMGSEENVGKYINSADSDIFHKGEHLYNLHRAMDASKNATDKTTEKLIIVEGYMDAIALYRHGLKCVVAPLGTALTETQLRMLWRLHSLPVMAFDGDKAGQHAAYRSAMRALPLLSPAHSLNYMFLPQGEDPDSYLHSHGRESLQKLIDESQNFEDFLWHSELTKLPLESYTQKANFRDRLAQICAEIKNPALRKTYEDGFRDRLFHYFRVRSQKISAKQKIIKRDLNHLGQMERAGLILLLVRFPVLWDEFSDEIRVFCDKVLDKFMEDLQIYLLTEQNTDFNSLNTYMKECESLKLWEKIMQPQNMILSPLIQRAIKLFQNGENDTSQDKTQEITYIIKDFIAAMNRQTEQQGLSRELPQDIRQGNTSSLIDEKFKALALLTSQTGAPSSE